MISGVVRGMEVIIAPGRLHFTFHDMGKCYPTTSTPRSVCARCVVADDARLDSFSAPSVAWETGKSGSGLKDVLQQQHHILKKESGVEVWRANDISLSGGAIAPGIPDGRRRLFISEIAEAAGVNTQEGAAQPEAVGVSGGIEPTQDGDAGLSSSKEGDIGTGFKFDLVQGIEDVTKRAEILKEEVTSSDSPYTPAEGPDAFGFAVLCVLLLVIFWLGNYFVPDLIFKDTVFKKEDPLNPTGTTSENGDLAGNKDQSPGESTEASKSNNVDNTGRSVSKVGTGFGRSTKQRRLKSAKRK